MPDNREVRYAAEILSDSYTVVKVHYHMPPASWYKDGLSRTLEDLELEGGEGGERERGEGRGEREKGREEGEGRREREEGRGGGRGE